MKDGINNMEIDNNPLQIKSLPTAVIIKDYIDGHPANYEEYLTEFINASKLVQEKGNEKFRLRDQKEQSQGQNDVYNSFYELDFKFLVDGGYMEGKRLLSPSITEYCPGVTAIGPSKKSGSQLAYDILKCFRDKTLDDLEKIERNGQRDAESRLLKQALKKLAVNKNILFFLPYDYSFENKETDRENVLTIVDCISEDLQGVLAYRKGKISADTFLAFISDKYFVITQEKHNVLVMYDMIDTQTSELYNYLFHINDY